MDDESREAFERVMQVGRSAFAEELKAVRDIGNACNPDDLLASVALHTLFRPIEHAVTAAGQPGGLKLELLAFALAACTRDAGSAHPEPQQVKSVLRSLERLVAAYPATFEFKPPDDPRDQRLFHVVDQAVSQHRLVRGDAYPEQSEKLMQELFGPFEGWLKDRVGVTPARCCEILWTVIRRAEEEAEALKAAAVKVGNEAVEAFESGKSGYGSAKEARKVAAVDFVNANVRRTIAASAEDLASHMKPAPSQQELDGLVELVGLTRPRQVDLGDPLEVREYPLFVTSDGRVFPSDLGHCFGRLVESIERVLEASELRNEYVTHRGDYLEAAAAKALRDVFGESQVFQPLRYPDPDHNYERDTDLDLLVYAPPFLVLGECKSNHMKLPSRREDVDGIKSSVQKIVGDSYEQARRALKYLEDKDEAVFREKGTGREVKLRRSELRRVFLLSVSQRHLANITSELANLDVFGLARMDQYPVSMHLATLQLVLQSAKHRATFLHYLERRQQLPDGPIEFMGDELDYFGCYLANRFQVGSFRDNRGSTPRFVALEGFTIQYDAYMYGQRGEGPPVPLPTLDLPLQVRRLYEHLHERETPNGLYIAFALLDLPDASLSDIESNIVNSRQYAIKQGGANSLSTFSGDTMVTVTVGNRAEEELLLKFTTARGLTEKYRNQARRSISFGIELESERPFEHALYTEFEWVQNDSMDEITARQKPRLVKTSLGKLPGRNDPCPCDSGKKFKKCCMLR